MIGENFHDVVEAVLAEREHQENKWGPDKPQSFPGFLLVIRKELEEAENAWMKNRLDERNSPLEEIVQVAAVAVACLERYGTRGIPSSTDDGPVRTR